MKKLFLLILVALSSQLNWAQSNKTFSLFLIGDAGQYSPANDNHKKLFQIINNYNENDKGIVFLGNYISPEISKDKSNDYEDLKKVVEFKLKDFDGPVCFVPGRGDWANGSSDGKDMIRWARKTLKKQFDDNDLNIPEAACPGPLEIEISESLVLILFDTQWWLHPYDTRFGKCDIEDESDVWTALQDALRRNRNKQIVVAGYHPVVSYGETGGRFPLPKSLTPVAVYRKFLGSRSDFAHPLYKSMKENLKTILNEFPNVIYASSEEQNFQYSKEGNIHQIIGGSLVGGDYLKENKVECGSREAGYSRLDFYVDGRVKINFYTLNNLDNTECSQLLYQFEKTNLPESSLAETFQDSISFSASGQYERQAKLQKWLGENYRQIWDTPIKVKVFDIDKEHGGLDIIKRGGGQQTHSIRMKAKNGHQYALRSIEKFVEGAMPSEMKNTFAIDLIQDNISASNPFAALPVAKLADAAGVLHTNPEFVYIPFDNRLGEYKEDLSKSLFLYEERPNGNWRDEASFGNSKKIVGTPDVIDETENKQNHVVNQKSVLRARLFDTFINDWDRHDDQWRWASFKKNGLTMYEPIPRDRDQAFYVNQGVIPRIIALNFLMPKIQGFAPLTPNMRGLTFNARFFDRAFLTEPDWEDWQEMIGTLQTNLSDDKIDEAVLAFPKEIQPLAADFTAETLKKRRENWEQMAREHYLLLANLVNVIGTDEDELFEINRINDNETKLVITELSKKKHKRKEQLYKRVFKTDETKEIRLYGLNGDDVFLLNGEVKKGITIRVIGGKGKDSIQNSSRVKTVGRQTAVYDLNKNTTLLAEKDTKIKLSDNKNINNYDRLGFRYNLGSPGIFMGYNADDGVFLGGGPVVNRYLFRRHNKFSILANYAALTKAYNVKFGFDSEVEIKGIDYHLSLDHKAPGFSLNYFGFGNNSEKGNIDKSYYRLQRGLIEVDYAISYRFGKTAFKTTVDGSINESTIKAGGFLKVYSKEGNTWNYVGDLGKNGLSTIDLAKQHFAGYYVNYLYSNLDKSTNPQRGVQLEVQGKQYFDLDEFYDPFFKASADFRAYLSFTRNPRTVLAFRLGGEAVLGDNYSFLESAKLGGKTNLRGYWTDRFYGDQSVYQNTELRYKMLDFNSYLLNGELGVLGFYDSGRVWHNTDSSGEWHHGYGGGFWMSPFEMTILTVTYNMSKETNMVQVTMNYKF